MSDQSKRKPGRPKGSHKKVPAYRLYKRTNRGIVQFPGQNPIYLDGPYDSEESWNHYWRLVGEWKAMGNQTIGTGKGIPKNLTVSELCLAYWRYAKDANELTGSLNMIRSMIRIMRKLYGETAAEQFSPRCFMAVREHMKQRKCEAGKGIRPIVARRYNDNPHPLREIGYPVPPKAEPPTWSKPYVQGHLVHLVKMFQWAVVFEMVPPGTAHALDDAWKLSKKMNDLRETEKVKPVPWDHVQATLPFLSPMVRDMVMVHWLCGMRSGELVRMRPCDIERDGPVWHYMPPAHKTAKKGKVRDIPIGPKAQEILNKYLPVTMPQAFVFRPRESLKVYQEASGTPQGLRKRKINDRFTTETYRAIIYRATRRANRVAHEQDPTIPRDTVVIPNWWPHQLRHSRATDVRKRFGIDVSRALLGHSSATTTEIYAERDRSLLDDVMLKIG